MKPTVTPTSRIALRSRTRGGAPGEEFHGNVHFIENLLDPDTRTVEVRIQRNSIGQGFRLCYTVTEETEEGVC
jgi:hypothetical protein